MRRTSLFRRFGFALWFILGTATGAQAQTDGTDAPIYQWERQYYGKMNGAEQLLYARAFERSQLSFADFDGDGDEDLFVGKSDGRLALFRNTGQNNFRLETEDFAAFHEDIVDAEKVRIRRPIDVGSNAAPTWIDIDDDGDLDLFIGSGDGTIFFYQNRGNPLLPVLELVTPAYMNLNVGSNSVPALADFNADRAPDLLVGNQQGQTRLFYNRGVASRALFCPDGQRPREQDPACRGQSSILISDIAPQVDANPTLIDWEQDGDIDLLIGKSNGRIDFYLNRGNLLQPQWELESERFLFINTGGFAAPRLFDVSGDGYPELLIGTSTSRVLEYENREPLTSALRNIPALANTEFDLRLEPLELMTEACAQIDVFPNCLPALATAFDLPLEQATSLEEIIWRSTRPSPSFLSTVIGAEPPDFAPPEGGEQAAEEGMNGGNADAANPPAAQNPPAMQANVNVAEGEVAAAPEEDPLAREAISRNQFWPASENFFNRGSFLPKDRHTVVTSGDWDGDGDMDLLLGSRSGALYAYVNQGSTEDPDWQRVETPVFSANQRAFSAPAFGDLDGDGDLDALVGKQSGELELLNNVGTAQEPEWQVADVRFAKIDVGDYSVPTLYDLDGDGDLDLLVGNGRGLIIYFENQGSAQSADFVLKSTRFGNVQTNGNAVPTVFFWNEDESADLLLGERSGRIRLLTHNPLPNYPVSYGWQQQAEEWQGLESVSHSVPHLMDLNGDQQRDLLLGDSEGNLLAWLFRGTQKPEDIRPPEPVLTANTLERPVRDDQGLASDVPEVEDLPPRPEDLPREPQYELVSETFANLNFGRRAVPAFLDLDGDGDLDMLVGTKAGQLLHYRNDQETEPERWTLIAENYLDYNGGPNAAPVFADLDRDGDADLLVGNERGSVLYWENRGSAEIPDFLRDPNPMIGVTSGRNAIPAVFDVNQDGYADLLLGNFRGNVRLYLQRPTETGMRFRLQHRRFLDLDVGLGAVPVFADLNNDQRNELVVGSDRGQLIEFRPEALSRDVPWGWKLFQSALAELSLPLGSFPVFVDIDGDGDLDLFVGTDAGFVRYYSNRAIDEE
jgi:hypothetical protein